MAKMYKNQYKVVIKTGAGTTVTADDSVVEGAGAAAYAAIKNYEQVIVKGEDETIIPYHAIDNAVITFTRAEVDKPEDTTCVEA